MARVRELEYGAGPRDWGTAGVGNLELERCGSPSEAMQHLHEVENRAKRRPKRRIRPRLPDQCNTYTSSKAVPSDVRNDAAEQSFRSNARLTRGQKGINKCPPDARVRDRRGPPAGERRDHFPHNILLTFYD